MPKELLDEIKEKFISGTSLRKLEKEYGISRKKLSVLLKKEGLNFRRGHTEEEIQKVKDLYKAGKSIKEIHELTSVGRNMIVIYLQQAGLREIPECQDKSKLIPPELQEKILQKQKEGLSITQIANALHISRTTVFRVLSKANVTNRDGIFRKYHFDENIFEQIDTEEKAYWLGFLYADGNVQLGERSCVDLALKAEDRKHVEAFASFINATPPLPITERLIPLKGKEFPACRVQAFSKKIASDLNHWGCTPNKSLTLQFPDFLDDSLMPHFMRGYFDGDGCVCLSYQDKTPMVRANVTGNKDFILKYEDYLVKRGIFNGHNRYSMTGEAIEITHGGNLQCKRLYDFFYSNATIYLDRKYNIFSAVFGGNSEDDKRGIKLERLLAQSETEGAVNRDS